MDQELQKTETSLIDRVSNVLDQVRAVDMLMKQVMREGEHYGVIPGTDKPTLLKSGAEKLCVLFQFAAEYEETLDKLSENHREYRIRCRLVSKTNGAFVGSGLGSASTMEKKWRWRTAKIKCPECGQEAILKDKIKNYFYCWQKKNGCGMQFPANYAPIISQESGQVENPDIADIYNTCLKIATKRSLVAAVLNATGASDLFTQDVEDLPEFSVKEKNVSPEKTPPQTVESTDDEIPAYETDEAKYFDLPAEIPRLFEALYPITESNRKRTERRRIEFCKRNNWNEKIILFELRKLDELNKKGKQNAENNI